MSGYYVVLVHPDYEADLRNMVQRNRWYAAYQAYRKASEEARLSAQEVWEKYGNKSALFPQHVGKYAGTDEAVLKCVQCPRPATKGMSWPTSMGPQQGNFCDVCSSAFWKQFKDTPCGQGLIIGRVITRSIREA